MDLGKVSFNLAWSYLRIAQLDLRIAQVNLRVAQLNCRIALFCKFLLRCGLDLTYVRLARIVTIDFKPSSAGTI